ncbi:hypothetical protein Shell_0208 [Staphylothermus hellenicus DSM 12710]|uniref:Uncharacterized protein n=1 Tax=Staphylothermus hellenicus (strain DSM 12710 / JCM 10830 / BK20S6-10-b1 / P8) TaxID=591019 RepID=D7DB02_STAHD|nr:hypothetical protein Shell_0208 [Staphylothermus hellenicus DSM 12710]
MNRIVATKRKPINVSENLALRPATQNPKIIGKIYKQLTSLNNQKMNSFLYISSIDFFLALLMY